MNNQPKPLDFGYTAELNSVRKDQWENIVAQFSDGNIYQTLSYGASRAGEEHISHLILRFNGDIVAAAQARIVRIPFLGWGAAYVRWGPFWQLQNQTRDPNVFRFALRALRNEYVCRQGLVLRIVPLLYDDDSDFYFQALLEEGFIHASHKESGRTLILDISPPIEILRKQLDQKWRNCLNRAERNGLEIIEGCEDNLFLDFIRIYEDLLQRKKFHKPNDISEFRVMQRKLLPELKMRVILCRSNGANTAGAIYSLIGDTCIYLFGATNNKGMDNKGSYLIQWRAIQWMKNNGCRYYNLNGINPKINPGTYHFKAGLLGKNGRDAHYLGCFDCYSGALDAKLVRIAELLFSLIKKLYKRL